MYNYTRRLTSLSICIPEDNEEVFFNDGIESSYIVNPDCEYIPAFSDIHTWKAVTSPHASLRYYLAIDICHKHFRNKEVIRKELQNALSGNFFLTYGNLSFQLSSTRHTNNIPDFLYRDNTKITRNGVTYFRYKMDIFAINNESGTITPVLMHGNLRKALPLLVGDRVNKISLVFNKQTILFFNDKFLKENPDKYMRSRLRQYITRLKREMGFSLKFVTTDFFNNMFVEVPKAGLFNSIKAIEARKELLLEKLVPKSVILTPSEENIINAGQGFTVSSGTATNIDEIELPF